MIALLLSCTLLAFSDPELPTELEADRKPKLETHGDVFLADATVLPVSGPPREHTSILVRGGKIAALLPGDTAPPAGVAVIDCKGRFVSPGVIDCHAHIAINGGVNEGASSVACEVKIADEVDPEDASIFRALAGGCTGAQLLHGSANAIGGQSAVVKLKYMHRPEDMLIPDAPRGVKFALGENPKQAGSEADPTTKRYPSSRMGVEAVIRRAFEDAKEYRRAWADHAAAKARGEDAEPPRRDLRLEALVDILEGRIRIHCHSYKASEILMLIRLADEYGIKIGTFQHVLEGYKVAPEMAKHGVGGSTFADWWAYKHEVYDAIPYNAALMAQAGVLVSINSDSSEHMRRLNLEAAKTMKYGGVEPTAALAMVTLNPAKQLGIDHRMGSIEVGKDADLAIWNADPLSVYSRCEMSLIDGEVMFERAGHPTALDTPVFVPELQDGEVEVPAFPAGPVARTVNPAPPVSGRVVLVNARIVPVSSAPIEGGAVAIENGRIAAIAAGPWTEPAGSKATVIDCKGLSIYPGMIDASTTLGLNEISSVPGSVDTREQGSQQEDLRVAVAIDPGSEHIPVARVNGITTAVVRPRGSLLAGQSALVHLDGWTFEEMTLVDGLALHVNTPGWGGGRRGRRGPPGNRPMEPGSPGAPNATPSDEEEDPRTKELLDLFESARRYGTLVDAAAKENRSRPPLDARLEALLPYARGERPVIFDADDEKAIVKVIDLAQKLQARPIVVGGREAWKVAGLLKKYDVPVLFGPVLSNPTKEHDPYDAPYAAAAVLDRAGVRFAFITGDSANVRNLPYQAAMAAAFGLDKAKALEAVTLAPARILGVDSAIGSIEVGKLADLVVTDGDLLEIRTQVKHVFIHGRDVPLETRHTRLYEQYQQRLQAGAR